VHAAIWRINQALENLGKTITFTEVESRVSYTEQLKELVSGIQDISTLIVLEGNPVYDAPADIDFAAALNQVDHTIHVAESANETSRECGWFANCSHPLEAWGDGLSYDGSHCIAQPMIEPLYGSRSTLEFLSILCGHDAGGLEIVRQTAAPKLSGDNADNAWAEVVHLGFISGSAAPPVEVSIADTQRLTPLQDWKRSWESGPLELIFTPSRQLFDGRFANNGWLQELPDFITKLTWDNAAVVSPRTARTLGLRQSQLVRVESGGSHVDLPVHIQPGHAPGTVTIAMGYGRSVVGRVGGNALSGIPLVGADASLLRTADRMYWKSDVRLSGLSGKAKLALSQDPFTIDEMGRRGIHNRLGEHSPLIRSGTFEEYRAFVAKHGPQVDESELKTEHDPDWTGHQDVDAPKESALRRGQLPIVQVADRGMQEHAETGDAHAADEHSHEDGEPSHDTRWPQGHGLHFENKSLTRGPIYSATHKWAMSIDLSKCNGCNACIIACQAENNVPVVGKEQVARGREMSWMRIDAYVIEDREHDPDAENADFKFQPVTCQHCENAPCETVCPVAATVHSDEGLNDMIYNRCIGTRYCGNNCPYKVRRFNYLNYSEAVTFIKYPNEGIYNEQEKQLRGLGMNPEVTVRSRGVMEKCTYCVQRIQNTRIRARNEKRPIGPNEITTACQDVCPTGSIVFGNMADRESDVHKNHRNVRAYQLLDQLNNLPRTRYLARVRNPHPALAQPTAAAEHHG
jgi:molybdopterin-containing oxidoreductase family iron-sulfur binding subunit